MGTTTENMESFFVTKLRSKRNAIHEFVEPAESGLPRWPVLVWFPVLLLLLLIILVALGLSGSSTGMFWSLFGTGSDPNLVAGAPQAIRSDEWLTQGPWIVAQWSEGFPRINEVFPGGSDPTVLLDLPARDWSTIFKPHTVGFLLFGLDRGLALRWWLPAFSMAAACYCFIVVALPRRPITSAMLAVGFFFCPLLQWWFLPSAFWPATLCFLVIAAVMVSLREPRRWVRWCWAAATGYVAVCTALTLYPPFLIQVVLIAGALSAGAFLHTLGRRRLGLLSALGRLVPIAIAGAAAAAALLVWAATRIDTIKAIVNTAYPGARVQPTGGAAGLDELAGILSAPFSEGLNTGTFYTGRLGANSSEASTAVLVGLFLIIPLIWFIIRDWRESRRMQWMMVGCVACTALLLAFLFVPGWDGLAHLFLLDRMVIQRTRLGLGLLSLIAIALLVRRLDRRDVGVPWSVSWVTTGVAALSIIVVWTSLASVGDPALTNSTHHRLIALVYLAAVMLFTRARPVWASLALLAISVVLSASVNPLYRGMFDLTETTMGRTVERIDGQRPGTWVGIGSREMSAVLFETGVESLNGVQTYPAAEMWQKIDPDDRYEAVWNRYASVTWDPGVGEPTVTNPNPDVVVGTFDSCSAFARQNVKYVMADRRVDQACLRQIDEASQGPSTYWFYEVTG